MLKIICLLLPLFLLAQNGLVERLVIDSISGNPIIDADVYFESNPLGTVTNSLGSFKFDFQKVAKDDVIMISHIGYKEYEMEVGEFLKSENKIKLVKEDFVVDEVVFSAVKPLNILKAALNNYTENHFTENITYEGFVKQVSEENKKITKFVYSDIFLKIPKKKSRKNKIIQKEKQYKKAVETKLSEFDFIKLKQLIKHLKIKTQLIFFIDNFKKFDKVILKRKRYGPYDVYEIGLESYVSKNKKYRIILSIEKEKKGIISVKIKNHRGEGVDRWHVILKNDKEQISRIPSYTSGNIVFRPYKGKWVLKKIDASLDVLYKIETKGKIETIKNHNYVSIHLNGMHNQKVKNSKAYNLDKDLFGQIKTNFTPKLKFMKIKELKFVKEN